MNNTDLEDLWSTATEPTAVEANFTAPAQGALDVEGMPLEPVAPQVEAEPVAPQVEAEPVAPQVEAEPDMPRRGLKPLTEKELLTSNSSDLPDNPYTRALKDGRSKLDIHTYVSSLFEQGEEAVAMAFTEGEYQYKEALTALRTKTEKIARGTKVEQVGDTLEDIWGHTKNVGSAIAGSTLNPNNADPKLSDDNEGTKPLAGIKQDEHLSIHPDWDKSKIGDLRLALARIKPEHYNVDGSQTQFTGTEAIDYPGRYQETLPKSNPYYKAQATNQAGMDKAKLVMDETDLKYTTSKGMGIDDVSYLLEAERRLGFITQDVADNLNWTPKMYMAYRAMGDTRDKRLQRSIVTSVLGKVNTYTSSYSSFTEGKMKGHNAMRIAHKFVQDKDQGNLDLLPKAVVEQYNGIKDFRGAIDLGLTPREAMLKLGGGKAITGKQMSNNGFGIPPRLAKAFNEDLVARGDLNADALVIGDYIKKVVWDFPLYVAKGAGDILVDSFTENSLDAFTKGGDIYGSFVGMFGTGAKPTSKSVGFTPPKSRERIRVYADPKYALDSESPFIEISTPKAGVDWSVEDKAKWATDFTKAGGDLSAIDDKVLKDRSIPIDLINVLRHRGDLTQSQHLWSMQPERGDSISTVNPILATMDLVGLGDIAVSLASKALGSAFVKSMIPKNLRDKATRPNNTVGLKGLTNPKATPTQRTETIDYYKTAGLTDDLDEYASLQIAKNLGYDDRLVVGGSSASVNSIDNLFEEHKYIHGALAQDKAVLEKFADKVIKNPDEGILIKDIKGLMAAVRTEHLKTGKGLYTEAYENASKTHKHDVGKFYEDFERFVLDKDPVSSIGMMLKGRGHSIGNAVIKDKDKNKLVKYAKFAEGAKTSGEKTLVATYKAREAQVAKIKEEMAVGSGIILHSNDFQVLSDDILEVVSRIPNTTSAEKTALIKVVKPNRGARGQARTPIPDLIERLKTLSKMTRATLVSSRADLLEYNMLLKFSGWDAGDARKWANGHRMKTSLENLQGSIQARYQTVQDGRKLVSERTMVGILKNIKEATYNKAFKGHIDKNLARIHTQAGAYAKAYFGELTKLRNPTLFTKVDTADAHFKNGIDLFGYHTHKGSDKTSKFIGQLASKKWENLEEIEQAITSNKFTIQEVAENINKFKYATKAEKVAGQAMGKELGMRWLSRKLNYKGGDKTLSQWDTANLTELNTGLRGIVGSPSDIRFIKSVMGKQKYREILALRKITGNLSKVSSAMGGEFGGRLGKGVPHYIRQGTGDGNEGFVGGAINPALRGLNVLASAVGAMRNRIFDTGTLGLTKALSPIGTLGVLPINVFSSSPVKTKMRMNGLIRIYEDKIDIDRKLAGLQSQFKMWRGGKLFQPTKEARNLYDELAGMRAGMQSTTDPVVRSRLVADMSALNNRLNEELFKSMKSRRWRKLNEEMKGVDDMIIKNADDLERDLYKIRGVRRDIFSHKTRKHLRRASNAIYVGGRPFLIGLLRQSRTEELDRELEAVNPKELDTFDKTIRSYEDGLK